MMVELNKVEKMVPNCGSLHEASANARLKRVICSLTLQESCSYDLSSGQRNNLIMMPRFTLFKLHKSRYKKIDILL